MSSNAVPLSRGGQTTRSSQRTSYRPPSAPVAGSAQLAAVG